MKTVPAFPLQWPVGWTRTPEGHRTHGKFGKRDKSGSYPVLRDVTVNDAVNRVREELRMLGVSDQDVVISTNLKLRRDGFPLSDQRQPQDTGVAVYWVDEGNARCMATNRYYRVADNLAGIAASLEAMRTLERHGSAEILSRAFSGFVALEAPQGDPWHAVLGVAPNADKAAIEAAWRRLRSSCHPDKPGGSEEAFRRARAAYERGIQGLE
jgi:hypothetical protein